MTVYEKLREEFGCAIVAVLGDLADKEFEEGSVPKEDIDAIARKVKHYLDLI
jgi:hypothetical protein